MVHVAARDGAARHAAAAADRRRHHQPPAHRRQDRARATRRASPHVLDASRAVGVVARLLDPAQRAVHRRRAARGAGPPAGAARHAARARRCTPSPRPARAAAPSSGAPRTSPRRRSPARRVLAGRAARARSRTYIDWTFFFHAWELQRQVPGDPRPPAATARRRASCTPTRTAMLDELHRRRSCSRARGVYGFWPANARRRRHRPLHRRDALDRARALPDAAPAARARPTTSRSYSLADFVAPRESRRCPTTSARFAVTAGIGADELAARFEARPRRLHRDHGQGARRPAGRGLRRDAARPRAPRVGLRRRRERSATRT